MINSNKIKLIRLITGEELIAEVLLDSDAVGVDNLRLRNPIRIVIVPNKAAPANPSVGFAPWSEFSDDKDFSIDKRHILVIMTPISQFKDQYNKTFSPIITPTSESIILPG